MRKAIFAAALLLLAVPFAAADTAPDTDPPVSPAAEVAPTEAPITLDEILTEVAPEGDAQPVYLCMMGSCTTDWDCQMNEDPPSCNYDRMCTNPSGSACAGTCSCC